MRPSTPAHPEDDRLLELAYGEVPASEARTLRQHVDGCARCRGVLDGYAEVRSAFRSVPAEPAPERGLDSLLAYGEQAAARARSKRDGLRILGLLSAAAALAVVWLVLPVSHREGDGLARAPEPKSLDRVARLDKPQAPPEQGKGVRDEAVRERKVQPPAAAAELAQKELPKMEEQTAPGRRAADAKRKEVAKRDAEDKGAADAPAELRAEASKDRAEGASGMLGLAGAGPSTAIGGAVASSGAAGLKKAGAGQSGADVFHQTASGAPASAASPPPLVARASADDLQAQDAARAVAAPVGEALASAERGKAAPPSDLTQLQPSRPLAKTAAPPSMKAAANMAAPVSRSIPVPAARVGLGSPEQQARLAEIVQKLETAKGDERKALMMERCELEAKMDRRPDVVLSCSKVTQEFPGTPEAARASQIARGFSVQPPPPPAQAPER